MIVISLFDLDRLRPVLACRFASAPDVTVAACEFIRSGAVSSRANVGENDVKPAAFGREDDLVRMPCSSELVELALLVLLLLDCWDWLGPEPELLPVLWFISALEPAAELEFITG